jgi:hypothetical protein
MESIDQELAGMTLPQMEARLMRAKQEVKLIEHWISSLRQNRTLPLTGTGLSSREEASRELRRGRSERVASTF